MSKTAKIAVMIDLDWALKRHHEVLGGIQKYARQRGGWQLVTDLYPSRDLERYDAIIGRITEEVGRKGMAAGLPMVNTWFSSPLAEELPTVVPDFESAAEMAADHLIARGFRNFGFAGYYQKGARVLGRAFKQHLKEFGFPCSSVFVSDRYNEGPQPWTRFSDKLEQWVDHWVTPIGVLSSQDNLNRHLANICDYKDVAVPRDVALIGIHNEPIFCMHPEMSLSSVELGAEQNGLRAAQLLDDLMAGKPPPREAIKLPARFMAARRSTDAYVVKDPLMAEALQFIAEKSHEPIKVDDVATGVKVTRRTLERRFKEHGERTVAQEILYFRIERLKRLLVQTEEPVKYLSHEVGFKDAVQMCTVFRRVEGITPSSYRRKHKGEEW